MIKKSNTIFIIPQEMLGAAFIESREQPIA
jgi:hypothetical protein